MYQLLRHSKQKHPEMRHLGPQAPWVLLEGKDHRNGSSLSVTPHHPPTGLFLVCSSPPPPPLGCQESNPMPHTGGGVTRSADFPPYSGFAEVPQILAHFMFFLGSHQSLTQPMTSPSIQAHWAGAGGRGWRGGRGEGEGDSSISLVSEVFCRTPAASLRQGSLGCPGRWKHLLPSQLTFLFLHLIQWKQRTDPCMLTFDHIGYGMHTPTCLQPNKYFKKQDKSHLLCLTAAKPILCSLCP